MRKDNNGKQMDPKFKGNRSKTSKGRSFKSNSRSKSNKESNTELDKVGSLKDDINDSTYYYTDNIIKEQITNYSFNQFTGIPFEVGDHFTSGHKLNVFNPSIMRICVHPSAGSSADLTQNVTNGVTLASAKNYYILSNSNAKTTNYAPQDVTMYMFAMCSIMELVSYIQRIMGTPYIYNVRNRNLPKRLIEIQGINYDDLVANMADYRIKFNVILQMINKLPIPANVRAFMKSSAMYSNYYVDDTSPMAAIYVMCPESVWEYDEANAQLKTFSNFGSTMQQRLDALQNLIDKVLVSSAFQYIYSDILRLADKNEMKLLNFGLVPDSYVAPILYSNEFNLWIDNLTLGLASLSTTATSTGTVKNDVTQDINNNTLNYAPYNTATYDALVTEHIVNFEINNPDIESRIAATRLMTAIVPTSNGENKMIAGSHWVQSIFMYTMNDYNDQEGTTVLDNTLIPYSNSTVATTFQNIIKLEHAMSKFKHAPRVYLYNTSDTTEKEWAYIFGDLDYYTSIDNEYLRRMFDAEWLTYLLIG